MKLLKRVSVILLATLITLTSLPLGHLMGTVDTADAAPVARFYQTGPLRDYYGHVYTFGRQPYMGIYMVKNGRYAVGSAVEVPELRGYRIKRNGKSYVGYCIEHGISIHNVNMYGKKPGKSTIEGVYRSANKDYIMRNIGVISYYSRMTGSTIGDLMRSPKNGGLGFKDSRYYNPKRKYSKDDWEAASRLLIHQTQQDFRNSNFDKKNSNGLQYQGSYWRSPNSGRYISPNHYLKPIYGKGAIDIFNFMAQSVKDHWSYSKSIVSDTSRKPKTIVLKDKDNDGIWEAKRRCSKRRAFDFDIVAGKGKNKLKVELKKDSKGYYYHVTYKGDPKDAGTFRLKKAKHRKDVSKVENMIIWENGSGTNTQTIITGHTDPINFYMKLSKKKEPTTTDNPEKVPPPEPEYFPSFEFNIEKKDLNPGFDGDNTTPMGDAELSATYVLLKNGEEVDRITLGPNGMSDTLEDQPWEEVEDFKRTESGQTKPHIVNGEDHGCGVEGPTHIDWDADVNYEIKEVRPDGRFIEPDTGIRKYHIVYHAETTDEREYACEKNKWTDIEYKVDRTVTEGDDSTEKEGVSEGTIDDVDEVLGAGDQTFINDVHRGKITLSKSLQNSNVFDPNPSDGAQEDSVKSLWTIQLNSGGFENHPFVRYNKEPDLPDGTAVYRVTRDNSGVSCETNPMKIGTNGDMVVLDLPFGEYTMKEVKADNESYVLEEFLVNIDEHHPVGSMELNPHYSLTEENDDRYDYNVRDKKKTNIIKVLKTNAETGKTVYEEGTKFYIKYKGNPLLADPTKSKHYNRFLPNAENISKKGPFTFECNANGEFVIPYEIPYGDYELYEWKLPSTYFVGEYKGENPGVAENHHYGTMDEEQRKALTGSNYTDIVSIYDKDGNRVKYKDKDKYKINEVFNIYKLEVRKQNNHKDGNPSQKVTAEGVITKTDMSYDKDNFSYDGYYRAIAMPNNNTKGKLVIKKVGEVLTGFKKTVENGLEIFKPVFEKFENLKDAVFGIFADEDIELNDGNLGGKFYDGSNDKEIVLDSEKESHQGNPTEELVDLLGNRCNEKVYDTGRKLLESGGSVWFLSGRNNTEAEKFLRIYITPEKSNTSYSYQLIKSDENYNYSYDVTIGMAYMAGGRNVTDIDVRKTTEAKVGTLPVIYTTKPKATVGDVVLDPIDDYFNKEHRDENGEASDLTTSYDRREYEADYDKTAVNDDDSPLDLRIEPKRYIVRNYMPYFLSSTDATKAEKSFEEGYDMNGDGDLEDEGDLKKDEKDTRTNFEWENKVLLHNDPITAGKAPVIEYEKGKFKTWYRGYIQGEELIYEFDRVRSDEKGEIIDPYTTPDGYKRVPFEGTLGVDNEYVIIKNETEGDFKVLLKDGETWLPSDEKGNYQQKIVEHYVTSYVQVEGDPNGFTYEFDGLKISAVADKEKAITTVEKDGVTPKITLGAGYTKETKGDVTTFTALADKAPVYYLTKDGVRTEMTYSGGAVYVKLMIPHNAVGKDYDQVVPTINWVEDTTVDDNPEGTKYENVIDWYSKLSPTNPVVKKKIAEGVRFKAERIESSKPNEKEHYEVELVSERGKEEPIIITYSDGYSAYIYKHKMENGNYVGTCLVDGLKKTIRFSKSQLVETITSNEAGEAVSSLLPLGKYYVKEISSPEGYVKSEDVKSVELKYKDRFTPLVWEDITFKNTYFEIEIDLEKAFQKSETSDEYIKGAGAKFGIYNAQEIKAGKETLKKGTLMGVVKPDESGKALYRAKLPEGPYYIKEISTRKGYELQKARLYFYAGDKYATDKAAFSYPDDGLEGKLILDSYGKGELQFSVQRRKPMPKTTINGTEYSLLEGTNEDTADKDVDIKVGKAETRIRLNLRNTKDNEITLPNGKKLTAKVDGNAILWGIDGATRVYHQEIAWTGTYSEYTHGFTPAKGENLMKKTTTLKFKGAGKAAPEADIIIEHTPITKEKEVWEDKNGNGIVDKDEMVKKPYGVLDKDGFQTYEHRAVSKIKDLPDTEFEIGKITEVEDSVGGTFGFILDKLGNVAVAYTNIIEGKNTEKPSITGTDVDEKKLIYLENTTNVRNDSSSDTTQIKINKGDNETGDVEPIKNNGIPEKPFTPPPYVPPTPDIPEIPDKPTPETPNKPNPIPKIRTLATTEKGGKIVKAGETVKFIDKVFLDKNFVKGKKYKAKGKYVLVSKDGKKVERVLDASEKEFTYTGQKYVTLTFTFSTKNLAGRKAVALEEVYEKKGKSKWILIAEHKDLHDEGQTVRIDRKLKKYGKTIPKTGVKDEGLAHLLTLFFSGEIFCLTMLYRKKLRLKKREGDDKIR